MNAGRPPAGRVPAAVERRGGGTPRADGNPSKQGQGLAPSHVRARSATCSANVATTNVATSPKGATRASYVLPPVDDPEIASTLGDAYAAVTGWTRVTPAQRRLLLVCYRRHGADTVPLLRELYGHSGTTTDLLAHLRDHPIREAASPQPPEAEVPSRPILVPDVSSITVDEVSEALDSATWVNPPCRIHKASQWGYRADGSPVCDVCHPPHAAGAAA